MANLVTQPAVPTTNSTLSKRRRFQPPITSYFATPSETSHNTKSVSHNHYSTTTSSATPLLPAKVQASLLSVGMRVRKSVADGYKTRMAMKDEKVIPTAAASEANIARPLPDTKAWTELAPFSGISRPTYGQPFSTSNCLVTDDGDAFSLPPSSQESIESSVSISNTAHGQKRHLDFESDFFADDSPDDEYTVNDSWSDVPLERPILSPRLGQQRRCIRALQQKAGPIPYPTMDLGDFEEASFLRRREEVDADYDMDCA